MYFKRGINVYKVETLFFIPYIGFPSITFGRKIRELFKKYYAIDVRVEFTTFKVRNYFSLKCKTPLALQNTTVCAIQALPTLVKLLDTW